MIPLHHVATLEEHRQAIGVAEIAPARLPLAGGWLAGGPVDWWFNQAVGLGMEGPVTEADLDALDAFYAELGCTPEVLVCPFAHESLTQGLARRGFALTGFETILFRGLGPDVDRLAPPYGADPSLKTRTVDEADADDVDVWVAVTTSGFRDIAEPIPAELDESHRAMLAHPRCHGLLVEQDGVAVCGASLEIAGEVAALMSTSTHPDHRRKGAQQAAMVARLRMARAAGCKVATIQSEPGIPTARNARRLGFQVAYTRAVLKRPERA